ncbi:MAG: hypothetical protein QXD60_02435 [Nanopusillaceae archaeon]
MSVVLALWRNWFHDIIADALRRAGFSVRYFRSGIGLPRMFWNFDFAEELSMAEVVRSVIESGRRDFIITANSGFLPAMGRLPVMYVVHLACHPLVVRRLAGFPPEVLEGLRRHPPTAHGILVHEGLRLYGNSKTHFLVAHEDIASAVREAYPKVGDIAVVRYPVWDSAPPEPMPYSERDIDVLMVSRYWKLGPLLGYVAEVLGKLVARGRRVVFKDYGTHAFASGRRSASGVARYADAFRKVGVHVLVGDLSREEYLRLLSRARVVFHASVEENFGIRIAEAMAFTPVVSATDEFWFRSLVRVRPNEAVDVIEDLISGGEGWASTLAAQREESLGYTLAETLRTAESVVGIVGRYVRPTGGGLTLWTSRRGTQ